MEGIRADSPSARALAAALKDERFVLLDVGCSGGIDQGWRVFGDALTAYGFDPAKAEVERLRAEEANPNVHYVNAFVGVPPGHPLSNRFKVGWRENPWPRLAVQRTIDLQQADAAGAPRPAPPIFERPSQAELAAEAAWFETHRDDPPAPAPEPELSDADAEDRMRRNQWGQTALADPTRPVFLPAFLQAEGLTDVDFIKIDVDGPDFDILRSIEALLSGPVLGAVLEVNYFGADTEHAHSFFNTDRFMRGRRFDLMDLTVRRYALAALPAPYLLEYPYVTASAWGRPLQGDALYLRDFGHPSNGPDPAAWSDEKLIKQAALYALFGHLDSAADLLVTHRQRLAARIDVEAILDMIAREAQGLYPDVPARDPPFQSYAEYMAAFERHDPAFAGVAAHRYQQWVRAITADAEIRGLQQEVERLAQENTALRNSRILRAVAPLRRLLGR